MTDQSAVIKPVRMCVCFGCTFAELKEAGVQSLQDAADHFGCGTNCGVCRPYIKRMIETGETEFPVFDLVPETNGTASPKP